MKHLSSIFLLAALGTMVLGFASTITMHSAFAQPASDDYSEVDAYVKETMRRFPIQGLALAIVKDDQIVYRQGYGTANADGDPATPQTPWLLCSVSKSITALAVQQLVAARKLNFDAPLQTYLPEFQLADQQAASNITIRHLLEHRSGISNQEGNEPYLYQTKTTFAQVLDRLASYRPTHRAGGHYEYSNLNYILLAQAISRATNQPYPDYVQKNILDPLEMVHSNLADYHTQPHAATGNVIAFGIPFPYDEADVPVMRGAGYITSTAEDMAHYLIALSNKGEYHGRSVLPVQGKGWYDMDWYWHDKTPGDDPLSIMGGSNSIQTDLQFFVSDKVGVVVLMNTRLEQLSPAPTADTIAFNIGRITMDSPYELPSNRAFYTFWVLLDSALLLLIASILWQALTLKTWQKNYQATAGIKRILTWIVIIFDLLICTGILALPHLANTRWSTLLGLRPDFAVPLLVISLCLGALGLIKVVRLIVAFPRAHRQASLTPSSRSNSIPNPSPPQQP